MAKKKERKIPEVLVFSDINNYSDDLASMVVLSYLSDLNLINIRGIVTELGVYDIRRRRAMYAKGAMHYLGYSFVRAVPGGDYQIVDDAVENNYPENELTSTFENAGMTILRSGTIFLQEYVKSVKDKNIVILLNAPFADFAKYIKATHDTILKKVKKIVVMGDTAGKDENGFYLPDLNCFNFKPCPEAAEFLFKYVQEKNIRLTVVPSKAAEDLKMDYACLDGLEKSKNPVAQQLLLSKKQENPKTMAYDMLSALALVDGMFKGNGGMIEKEEGSDKNVLFASIEDADLMKAKLCEIFKEKLAPKKISLEHLSRPKEEPTEVNGENNAN